MARRRHYHVYVIEPSKGILYEGRFKRCNPDYIHGKPCIWDEKWFESALKDNVRIVDYRTNEDGIAELRARYNFVDASRAEYFLAGFCNDAIEFLFSQSRTI